MSRVDCLTDHAKRILHWTKRCRVNLALIPPATNDDATLNLADAISCLAQAVENMVLADEPLWENRDEGDCPYSQEEP